MKDIIGWWEVEIKAEYFDDSEIEDFDLEHIAEMIKQGYRCGQLVKCIEEV